MIVSKMTQSQIKSQDDSRLGLKKLNKKMGKSIRIIKLRKALIAVLFVNRMKHMAPVIKNTINHDALTIS